MVMKLNMSTNQTKYILLDVCNTHSIFLEPIGGKGHKYVPVFLMDTLGELMHTLELRQSVTHNPKGLPIVFFYSLHDGCKARPSSIRGARKVCFKLPSCLKFCIDLLYLRD